MVTISTTTAYLFALLLLYCWIVGGLGWKGVYEKNMDRTFTRTGTAVLVLLWVPLTLWSAVMSTLDTLNKEAR